MGTSPPDSNDPTEEDSRGIKTTTAAAADSTVSLEQRLFRLLKDNHIRNPSVKEFNECWAFATKAVQPYYTSSSIQIIVDVAGGHGALGAMLLILFSSATHAIVIDPAAPTTTHQQPTGVQRAWNDFLLGDDQDMRLLYRSECLRLALPQTLQQLIHGDGTGSGTGTGTGGLIGLPNKQIHPSNILVVACHACQHLSEETASIAYSFGVHVALMPCCQKDHQGSFKAFAKSMGIPLATVMDILLAGKCQSWMMNCNNNNNVGPSSSSHPQVSYQVKMRTIDSSITPQNRLILCKAQYASPTTKTITLLDMKYTIAHTKLQLAYQRAHKSGVKIKEDTLEHAKDNRGVEQFTCKPVQEELATQNHERVSISALHHTNQHCVYPRVPAGWYPLITCILLCTLLVV